MPLLYSDCKASGRHEPALGVAALPTKRSFQTLASSCRPERISASTGAAVPSAAAAFAIA
jgi:hypothetical protein